MKASSLKPILISAALALLLSAAGCTSMTGESAGNYVDDSTLTSQVKTKLVAEKAANLTRIDVIRPIVLFLLMVSSSLPTKKVARNNWPSK